MSDVLLMMERIAHALGHAVVQSLWQCVLIGAFAAAVQIGIRRPAVRYAVWCVALGLCAGWFGVTLGSGLRSDHGPVGATELSVLGIGAAPVGAAAVAGPGISGARGLGLFESIAAVWALGFVYVGVRVVRQYGSAVRLRTRGVTEASGVWAGLYADVRASLGVAARVRLLVSDVARSPMVVGWLTPTVVVPASVLTMMSPEQVRLVLAHELAHIRRYDHVVNMLQVLVETVMFYHPVVWWMSRQARVEREHCCDDVAVRWGGDAVSYARALTDLEEVRVGSRAVLAMKARSHGGSLMKRVRRLFDGSDARRGSGSMRALAVLTVAAVISGAAYAHSVWNAETPREETVAAVRAGVESGVMTRDQARRVFREVILPGSDLERLFDRERAVIRDELRDAAMSEADAKKKLEVVERSIDTRIELAFRMRVLGMEEHEAELSMFQERLERLVQSGWLTREDADGMYRARIDSMRRGPAVDEAVREANERRRSVEVTRAVIRSLEAQIADVELSIQRGDMDQAFGDVLLQALRRQHADSLLKREEAERALQELLSSREAERDALQGAQTQRYEVVAGDTLRGISQKVFGTPDRAGEIAELNGIEAGLLRVGMKLVLPEAIDPGAEPVELEIKVEPVEKERKLTPMDEAFWHHQGVRSLSEYEEEIPEDC